IRHAHYRFTVFLRPETLRSGWNRNRIVKDIQARGATCSPGPNGEMYLEKAFSRYRLEPPERLPIARELGETSILFPVHPTLSEEYLHYTAEPASEVIERASR